MSPRILLIMEGGLVQQVIADQDVVVLQVLQSEEPQDDEIEQRALGSRFSAFGIFSGLAVDQDPELVAAAQAKAIEQRELYERNQP